MLTTRMYVGTGIEGTLSPKLGVSCLQTNGHYDMVGYDLEMLARLGITDIRYPVPWYLIECREGVYDWDWMDRVMELVQRLKIRFIADPAHHTSYPSYIEQGYADPNFIPRFVKFCVAFAKRYPWVKDWNIVNEPFVTMLLCGSMGVWHPHYTNDTNFIHMLRNATRAMCLVAEELMGLIPGVRFLNTDPCEHHTGLDDGGWNIAQFNNERRFIAHDLVLGMMTPQSPIWSYLWQNGTTERDLQWYQEHRMPRDRVTIALDLYAHSQIQHRANGEIINPSTCQIPFWELADQYYRRYQLPMVLGETNIVEGMVHAATLKVSDRISWLRYTWEQCEIARFHGIPINGFYWWPGPDPKNWKSLLQENDPVAIDPQGFISLAEDGTRHETELTRIYSALAQGKIDLDQIPAYRFSPEVERHLTGIMPHIQHWNFVD